MPLDMIKVTEALRGPLSKQLVSVEVINVEVVEDIDHDGDQILRVKVTFRANNTKLDPSKVKGLIRHLRSALAMIDVDRFPVVSFRTDLDAATEAA